jgi:hypothetical protein
LLKAVVFVQLNEYKTDPYFLQLKSKHDDGNGKLFFLTILGSHQVNSGSGKKQK